MGRLIGGAAAAVGIREESASCAGGLRESCTRDVRHERPVAVTPTTCPGFRGVCQTPSAKRDATANGGSSNGVEMTVWD
jgi:hypothetical protein